MGNCWVPTIVDIKFMQIRKDMGFGLYLTTHGYEIAEGWEFTTPPFCILRNGT